MTRMNNLNFNIFFWSLWFLLKKKKKADQHVMSAGGWA